MIGHADPQRTLFYQLSLETFVPQERRLRFTPRTLGADQGFFHQELFGEGKDWHGLRRFHRRGLHRVRQEAHLIGWVLNLKRPATALTPTAQPT